MTLVEDNLRGHRPTAFHEVYPPKVAKAYLEHIEFVFTPAHGPWLDIAEIEFSVLKRDCASSYATRDALAHHIAAGQDRRNATTVKSLLVVHHGTCPN
jgi:hypothetical protein